MSEAPFPSDSLAGSPAEVAARGLAGEGGRLLLGLCFVATMIFSVLVLLHFHDRSWWGPDEGAYAHVAERILQGEVLNGSVQDIHLGAVNFANALAFKIFGLDLVSLRYPLVLMTLIQTALVFWLLARCGALTASAGATAMAALSLVQFLNPTAHWYALFFLTLIVALLSLPSRQWRGRLELLGFLLITLFLFRQLSGVFAAMGVLTFLLLEESQVHRHGRIVLARLLAAIMLVGLAGYLLAKSDLIAGLAFGLWPLGLLVYVGFNTRLDDGTVLRRLGRLSLGGLLAFAPLLAYHLANGSLESWLNDTLLVAFNLTELDFITEPSYAGLALRGLGQAVGSGSTAAILNGLFWFVLTLLPTLLGLSLLRALLRREAAGRAALPVLATFYALVSLHFQIPLYLFYATAITLAAILLLQSSISQPRRWAAIGLAVCLSAVGLFYQAGQPVSRGWEAIVAGERHVVDSRIGFSRATLLLTAEEATLYRDLVALIRIKSRPDDSILALPVNPELYFLAERRNPLRYFNAALGLPSAEALQASEEILRRDPPRLIFYRPDDKYTTARVRVLMAALVGRYQLIEEREGFRIYVLQAAMEGEGSVAR